ncbi:alpha/beta fold hydrolase [Brevundimonas diminuta]|nr:alpha/beta fold hydrolase [Brevundimonas diminuta]
MTDRRSLAPRPEAAEPNRRTILGGALLAACGPATGSAFHAGASVAAPLHDRHFADEAAARRHERDLRFVDLQQGRIACIDRGAGPCALFLHGFPLTSFQWRDATEALAAERRCLAPDLMGLGRTEPVRGQGVAPADQVAMLAALLDRLHVSRVDVVANDCGGAIAQLFAIRFPSRVRSLLLTNCNVEIDSPPHADPREIDRVRLGLLPDVSLWLDDKVLARSAEGLGGLGYSDPTCPGDPGIEEYLRPLVRDAARKAMLRDLALGLAAARPLQGAARRLRTLQAPIALVWGLADTIVPRRNANDLASLFGSRVRLRGLETGKLFFPEEAPDVIVEEARRLWREGDAA